MEERFELIFKIISQFDYLYKKNSRCVETFCCYAARSIEM